MTWALVTAPSNQRPADLVNRANGGVEGGVCDRVTVRRAQPAARSPRLVFSDLAAMAEQQQFYILLGNLMSPDNSVRKLSEVRGGEAVVHSGGCRDHCAKAYPPHGAIPTPPPSVPERASPRAPVEPMTSDSRLMLTPPPTSMLLHFSWLPNAAVTPRVDACAGLPRPHAVVEIANRAPTQVDP